MDVSESVKQKERIRKRKTDTERGRERKRERMGKLSNWILVETKNTP